MNKLFISGSVGSDPKISYTPKGQKILRFPMRVDEGGFTLDIVFAGEAATSDAAPRNGKRILVAGALAKMKTESSDAIRVKATKILPMEE